MATRGFGRCFVFDKRDSDYMVRDHLSERPHDTRRKFWWGNGWWGDVSGQPWSVEYAWRAAVCDGGGELDLGYGEFNQLCCGVESKDLDTTIRAGAKVLKRMGMIREYRWCFDAEDIITTVLTTGPVVMGTDWFAAMNYPNAAGLIQVDGGKVGEHAYLINGIDLNREVVRIKNCWGRTWGRNGYALLSFYGLDKLMWENGDACYAALSKSPSDAVERASRTDHVAGSEPATDSKYSRNPNTEMAEVV